MGAAIAEFFGSTVVYFLIGQDFNSYHNINTVIALLAYKVVSTCRRSQSAFFNRRASDEQQSRRRVYLHLSVLYKILTCHDKNTKIRVRYNSIKPSTATAALFPASVCDKCLAPATATPAVDFPNGRRSLHPVSIEFPSAPFRDSIRIHLLQAICCRYSLPCSHPRSHDTASFAMAQQQ